MVWWLSGLTCTDENFVTKAGAQRYAAELGLASKALPAAEVLPAAREIAREVAVNAAPVSVAIST